MAELSIVIPVMNEEKNVGPLHRRLTEVIRPLKLDYEILFVDDGSTDHTFDELKLVHAKDKRVKVIQFRKNFEKAVALIVGLKEAKGDYIITMDGDLQDNPDEVPRLIEKIKHDNLDLVVGWKYKRKDPMAKIIASRLFNGLVRMMTKARIHDVDCNFRIMKKEVAEEINFYGGLYRYIPVLAQAKGFKVGEIKVEHQERKFGKSKYGFGRLFKGFLDLFTMKFITTYTKRPMHLFGSLGILFTGAGTLISLYLLALWLQHNIIGNRPLLLLGILLIVLGIQFFSLGLLGELIISSNSDKNVQYSVKSYLK